MNNPINQYKSNALANTEQFPAMLEKFKGEIARALPKHMSGDRLARIALTEFRKNKALAQCDPRSVFAAVIMGSQLGLEPGIMGQSYLVPYGKECQFIPGWQGYVDLVSRTGRATVWTGAVFQGDEFDYSLGDKPFVNHRPSGEDDPLRMTHTYAIGRVNGCEWPVIEVWTAPRLLKHRDKFNKVGKRHYSFANWEMYCRKVVLLQVIKYMPKSVELNTAADLDYAAERGAQKLDANEAINGAYSYVSDDAPEQEEVVDQNTGEVLTKPHGNGQQKSAPSMAGVQASLESSKTLDQLNEAADWIREVANPAHRDLLNGIYEKRAAELQ